MEAQEMGDVSSLPSSEQEKVDEQASQNQEPALPSELGFSEDIYEPVENLKDKHGYLLPRPGQEIKTQDEPSSRPPNTTNTVNGKGYQKNSISNRSGVFSIYQDLWSFSKDCAPTSRDGGSEEHKYHPLVTPNQVDDESIYDEVDTVIPASGDYTRMHGAKIIPIEEAPSAYSEVIVNEGRYMIPSARWDSDSDAWESDFDDEEAPSYFGNNLKTLYESMQNRKVVSPTRTSTFFEVDHQSDLKPKAVPGLQQALLGCLPISSSSKSSKSDEESTLYVDPNSIGSGSQPILPTLPTPLQTLTADEVVRHEIVNKILSSEAMYMVCLKQLVQVEEEACKRSLLETEKLEAIFCSVQDILQCHEMFNMVLAERLNGWSVHDKLGDIICASFSKSATMVAYINFVNNFPNAIDTYRAACKSSPNFAQFLKMKEKTSHLNMDFHDIMLKPLERFPEFILLIQDLLEVTPVHHIDRVPLQLSLTQLECLAENINLQRRETDMKNQVKYLDSQISQLNKPLSSSGRVFVRQDDVLHCLVDGVSILETKKLRLVLLSDMLLCLSPINKKKKIVSSLLNTPKYKYKLKWNVPLLDVQFVEYGAGVSVAADKYGTTTTYSDKGKYRQATVEVRQHIEDLQHDLAVVGQIAGLTASLRGKHELIDQQKVEKWYKSVENSINEEIKAVNMFWMEISLPTRSGQQNYVFNLSSPTAKEEFESATRWAKLALETRNNPGWYLPDDDSANGVSILRRNMPLLAELFDVFIFGTKSRVEHTLTYPVEVPDATAAMATKGSGHYIWISARGDLQGHVTVLQIERNLSLPRFVESFHACPTTVYSMARIPAMNSRADQKEDKYHTKYGFPFPTMWFGSQSCRIYIHDARSEDRTKPLMELKLRDAPLAMKYANRKIYVGLANGTLAIFRQNSEQVWNLMQPSILPLGRFPVAVIADVKHQLWCGSGSQIYVVNKNGSRIQRIIAVDSIMKNLVKQIVSCDVGVWVSVWRKPTVKLYHVETLEMLQEINVVRPVMKMKNDVDSQVQYLALDKLSVTALVVIPGFLWVGTSCGLILVYPLPKLQGVPRVINHACVAFHAHSGPVRSLFAVPEGITSLDEANVDDDLVSDVIDENAKEIKSKLNSLESDESVDSDEEFSFVDDRKPDPGKSSPSVKKSATFSAGKFMVSLKKRRSLRAKKARSEPVVDIPHVGHLKSNDFALMMESFDGFSKAGKRSTKGQRNVKGDKNVEDKKKVKSFKNRLYTATYPEKSESVESGSDPRVVSSPGEQLDTNIPSGKDTQPDKNTQPDNDTPLDKDTLSDKDAPPDEDTPPDNDNPPDKDIPPDNDNPPDKDILSDESTPSEEKPLVHEQTVAEGNFVPSEKDTVSNEVEIPEAQSVEVSEEGTTLVPDENPSVAHDQSPVEEGSEAQNNETKQVDEQLSPGVEVQVPHGDESSASGDRSSDDEHVYVNIPRVHKKKAGDGTPEDVPQENVAGETAEQQTTSTLAVPGENPQDFYTVVLPAKKEPSDADVYPKASEEAQKTGTLQPTESSQRGVSYLVVSAGEGHVDMRMKLKSKSDVKKDLKTMLLIWRVNSKA